MAAAGGDGGEVVSFRSGGLTVPVAAPCGDKAVGFEGEGVVVAGGNGDEIVARRDLGLLLVIEAPGFK